jgi:cytochrome c oxidase subunit IV
MSDSLEAVRKHVRSYKIIGVSLILLTFLTVGVSYFHFGKEGDNTWNITVALIIATVKAALVATIFMHLFWDMFVKMAVIFKVMVFTVVFFAGLMVLTLWTLHDEPRTQHDTHLGPMFRYPVKEASGEGHHGH